MIYTINQYGRTASPPILRTPDEIVRDGGSRPGETIPVTPTRSGEDAQREWEKEHGNLDEPAFKRKERKEETGEM